uniref:lipase member H n=1 Tax=Monopterus albus TaxID=43700 RepID=UPI0009B4BD87|nr:lipase member H-like [Monopterus albus]
MVVDWNKGAANLNYFTAVAYTREAAHNLTGFIQTMEEGGASLSSVYFIGISLGAHLAGFVGANLKGKIGHITGLDPAGQMFISATLEERLDPSDAMFVDVLHTDMNSFGMRGAHGHIDFYANGGADQPGCPRTIFTGKSYFVCNHQRSVFLFLCTLNQTCSLTGYLYLSYRNFLDARCLQCDAFKPASCPVLGYDVSQWRETLLRLGQTQVFFSTTGTLPYKSESNIFSHNISQELQMFYGTRLKAVAAVGGLSVCHRAELLSGHSDMEPVSPMGVVYIRLHSRRSFTEARIDQ